MNKSTQTCEHTHRRQFKYTYRVQTHLCTYITKAAVERRGPVCGKEMYFTQMNNQLFIGATGSEHQHKHSSNLILPHYSRGCIAFFYRRLLLSEITDSTHSSQQGTRIHLPSRSILEALLQLCSKLYTSVPGTHRPVLQEMNN